MRPVAVQLSYRLGGADGVAVEARKWEWALHELGFDVRRVAGELDDGPRPDDAWLPSLAIDPVDDDPAEPEALAAAIAGAQLVVVENLCSLPINPDAVGNGRRGVVRTRRSRRLPPSRPAVATRWLADTVGHSSAPRQLAPRHDQRPLPRAAREPRLRRGDVAKRVRPRSAAWRSRGDPRQVRVRSRRPRPAPTDSRDPAQEHPRRGHVRRRPRTARARIAISVCGSPDRRKTATTTCSPAW